MGFFRSIVGQTLRSANAIAAGAAQLASFGSSAANMFSKTPSVAFLAAGIPAGAMELVAKFYLPGKSIAANIQGSLDGNRSLESLPTKVTYSRLRSLGFYTAKYGYTALSLTIHFFDLYFLYASLKAFIDNVAHDQDNPLAHVEWVEMLALLIYYGLVDVPFLAATEWSETYEGLEDHFNIEPKALTTCVANNAVSQHYVRTTGSLSHSLQHLVPIVTCVPPWMFTQLSFPLVVAISSGVGVLGLLCALTILPETYLFEGAVAVKNMQGQDAEVILARISPKTARFFKALILTFGGPLHGLDCAFPIYVLLQHYFKFSRQDAALISLAPFITALLGSYASEVYESVTDLNAMIERNSDIEMLMERFLADEEANNLSETLTEEFAV